MPTKRDRRISQQEEIKQTFQLDDAKVRGSRRLVWAGLAALVLAGLAVFFVKAGQPAPFDVTKVCIGTETYHIHPHLSILVDGAEQTIPKGIGMVSPVCIRPLHTHETDGVIHVEFDYKRDFTLGEFFQVWGQPYGPSQVWTFKKDDTHDLTLTVDGLPMTDWNGVVLKEQQKIVINYLTKSK